jgi:release factor glutamine methyltransferase
LNDLKKATGEVNLPVAFLFMMTIREAWHFGRSELANSATPDTDARLLLEHVLGATHAFLVAHDEQPLTPTQEARYRRLIQRAIAGEPIPYLTGTIEFYGLEFYVNSSVLIPRPETELLVETAIRWARPRGTLDIVDVGTGSGCIAVSLAAQLPQASIQAVDISAEALAVAQQNAARHAPERIIFRQGHLLNPIVGQVDLIAANLPYVAADEWTAVDRSVQRYEPRLALDGGTDGLDLIRELLSQAAEKLRPAGLLLLEIGWRQGAAVRRLAGQAFPTAEIKVQQDFADHDRLVIIHCSAGC